MNAPERPASSSPLDDDAVGDGAHGEVGPEVGVDELGRGPSLLVFDVNETLSDMGGMAAHFAAAGAAPELAGTWFASLLRDGFALTVDGANPDFAELARTSLVTVLAREGASCDDEVVDGLMEAFMLLPVHGDVVAAVTRLAAAGLRLVTLSNGSVTVAKGLLERNDMAQHFERLLSVQDAAAWKPHRLAYEYALDVCGLEAGDAMLVAVHPWDIHGAHSAGMRTAFINRTGATYPGCFSRPEIEVDSLAALADALGRHGR